MYKQRTSQSRGTSSLGCCIVLYGIHKLNVVSPQWEKIAQSHVDLLLLDLRTISSPLKSADWSIDLQALLMVLQASRSLFTCQSYGSYGHAWSLCLMRQKQGQAHHRERIISYPCFHTVNMGFVRSATKFADTITNWSAPLAWYFRLAVCKGLKCLPLRPSSSLIEVPAAALAVLHIPAQLSYFFIMTMSCVGMT